MENFKELVIEQIKNSNSILQRIEVSDNFFLDEFIDPFTYLTSKDRGLSKMDFNVFNICQELRNDLNSPLSVNNWWSYFIENECDTPYTEIIQNIERSNTINKWSGYRPTHCRIGSRYSAHRLGKAADPKGNSKILMNLIRDNPNKYYNIGLRRLEDIKLTPTWLHVDTLERNTKVDSIRVVDLTKATEIIKW